MNSEGIEKRCLVACHQDLIDQGLCQCNKKITMNDKTRTAEEIREEIKQIRENQEGLRLQGRHEEVKYWNDIIFHLKWVLNE